MGAALARMAAKRARRRCRRQARRPGRGRRDWSRSRAQYDADAGKREGCGEDGEGGGDVGSDIEQERGGGPAGGSKSVCELVVFADAFGRHPSSVQHLVRAVAVLRPGLRVLWVELPQRAPRLAWQDLLRMVERLVGVFVPRRAEKTAPSFELTRLAPFVLPWRSPARLARLSDRLATRRIRRALRQLGFSTPAAWVVFPAASGIAISLELRPLVFYRVDDFALWPGVDANAVRQDEARLIACADLVVAPAQHLLSPQGGTAGIEVSLSGGRPPAPSRQTMFLPHGVDSAHFAAVPGVHENGSGISAKTEDPLAGIPHPRLLYAGLIDERIDAGLLLQTLEQLSEARLVLLGPMQQVPRELVRHPRVVVRPGVPFAELPRWLHAADVLLLPYGRTPLGDSLAPLKLRECVATGLPVVSTAIPAAAAFDPCLLRFGDGLAFVEAVAEALREPPSVRADRRQAMLDESWQARAAQLLDAMDRLYVA